MKRFASVTFLLSSFLCSASDFNSYYLQTLNSVVDNLRVESRCDVAIKNSIDQLKDAEQSFNEFNISKQSASELFKKSFQAKLALHEELERLQMEQPACQFQMKSVFNQIRRIDDLIGSYAYKAEQKNVDKIDYTKIPAPVYESEKYAPFHLNPKFDHFEFKNGDIMITKGISVISSTISNVSNPTNLFSHIVFVHVDKSTGKVETMESYIGKGVTLFSIEDALKNENARILILRAKDQNLASDAADYMYERITKLKKQGQYIAYDFDFDFEDNSKLSCEEVAYDAFKTASSGSFVIPESSSLIGKHNKKFLKRFGLHPEMNLMLPADMETDSRFDIVLDWTDYSIIRDSIRKDHMMNGVISWLDFSKKDMHNTFKANLGAFLWKFRKTFLWPKISKIMGIPVDFTPDVPGIDIKTMANLKAIEADLISPIRSADQQKFSKTGQWMTSKEMNDFLNRMRLTKRVGGKKYRTQAEKDLEIESQFGVE